MSAEFRIYCMTHERRGPWIRRVHNHAVLRTPGLPATEESQSRARDELGEFLIRHEWCDLRLIHEGKLIAHENAS